MVSELSLLKKQIEEEKRKAKKQQIGEEKRKLKKELRRMKIQNNPFFQKVKSFGSAIGKAGSNFVINTEAHEKGVHIGDKIMITNGILTGKTMIVNRFISGGVEGHVEGFGIAKIRHISYKKV